MQTFETSANSSGASAGSQGRVAKRIFRMFTLGAIAAYSAALAGCSGESDSGLDDDDGDSGGSSEGGRSGSSSGGSSTTGGDSSTGGDSTTGGNSTTGGSSQGGRGGSEPTGGTDEGGSGPGPGGECMEREEFTIAVHAVVPVTWPGTLGTQAGNGDFHVWTRVRMTADGMELTGETAPCGSVLPPLQLTVLIGGGMSLVEIPPSVWDMPSFPKAPTSATLAGWTVGSALKTNASTTLVGAMMADPEAAWPADYTALTPVDVDGDGKPGITSVPRTGGGYNAPPVSIVGPKAGKIYLASRTALELEGELSSCSDLSGKATLQRLDSHVIGCETEDGTACTAAQAKFLDDNRTKYVTMPGTFKAKIVDDDITCAAVREQFPM